MGGMTFAIVDPGGMFMKYPAVAETVDKATDRHVRVRHPLSRGMLKAILQGDEGLIAWVAGNLARTASNYRKNYPDGDPDPC